MSVSGSSPVSTTLDGLFRDHQNTTKTFSDMTQSEIVTQKGLKYQLYNITNSRINMNAGCTKLMLHKCKNLTIIAEKFPIMGISMIQTDNTRMDIMGLPKTGLGFVNLDRSVIGILELNQDCMVEVNECIGIILNGTNISDQYRDSTWRLTTSLDH